MIIFQLIGIFLTISLISTTPLDFNYNLIKTSVKGGRISGESQTFHKTR